MVVNEVDSLESTGYEDDVLIDTVHTRNECPFGDLKGYQLWVTRVDVD